MTRTTMLPALLAASLAVSVAALAQTMPPVPQRPPGASKTMPPEVVKPPMEPNTSGTKGALRHPREVDPGIVAPTPTPAPQSMPVIPPPGSPGGNPNVIPK
jgi:hypothetical protein